MLPSSKPIFSLYLQKWNVTKRDVTGRFRDPHICKARVEIARALWNMDFSVTRIAKLLDRDHSTVSYYIGLGTKKFRTCKGVTVMAKRKLTAAQRAELVRLHNKKPALATQKAKELGVSPNYGCILAGRIAVSKMDRRTVAAREQRKMSAEERKKWDRAIAAGPINVGADR
jgi:predicted transcriptional regulator